MVTKLYFTLIKATNRKHVAIKNLGIDERVYFEGNRVSQNWIKPFSLLFLRFLGFKTFNTINILEIFSGIHAWFLPPEAEIILRIENQYTNLLDCLCIISAQYNNIQYSFFSGRGKTQFTIDDRCRSSRRKGKILFRVCCRTMEAPPLVILYLLGYRID